MKKVRLLIAVLTLLGLSSALTANAADWKGHTPSEVAAATENDTKEVYLYNPKTKAFVNVGGYWGTQPALHTVGLPMNLVATGNYYKIDAKVTKEGKRAFIGFVRSCDTESKEAGDYNQLYVDRIGTSGNYDGIVKMSFTEISGKDKVYTISFFDTGYKHDTSGEDSYTPAKTVHVYEGTCPSGHTVTREFDSKQEGTVTVSCDKHWFNSPTVTLNYKGTKEVEASLGTDSETAGKTFYWVANGTGIDVTDTNPNDGTEEWVLVTLGDLKADFNNTEGTEAQPADATFAVKAQNFNRENGDISTSWVASTRTIYQGDESKLSGNYCYAGIGANNGSKDPQKESGKYWTAKINGSASMYQDVNITVKAGWYVVRCKGVSSVANGAKLYVKVLDSSKNTTTNHDNSKEINFVTGAFDSQILASQAINASASEGGDNYLVSAMVYVPATSMYIRLGVKATGGVTYFDDVQLKYVGGVEEKLLILEDATDIAYLNAQRDYEKSHVACLVRSFKENKWNSFVMPVNLTAGQVKDAFGGSTLLSQLANTEVGGKRINFSKVDLSDNETIAIEAGKMYIIKPGIKMPEGQEEVKRTINGKEYSTGTSYYMFSQVALNPKDENGQQIKLTGDVVGTSVDSEEDNGIQFMGTYVKKGEKTTDNSVIENPAIPAKSYILSDGKWYYSTTAVNQVKGLRGWLTTDAAPASAKDMIFVINGVEEGVVTGIEGVENTVVNKVANGHVFNLNGQLVRANANSLEGLEKGVYIVNGKKVVVK